MIEALVSNVWTEEADAICITTNGFTKRDGSLVMGAGVAKQAMSKYPALPKRWGLWVQLHGNRVFIDRLADSTVLFTFPVKYNWFEKADLGLIERSSHDLMEQLNKYPELKKVLLPLPGCGNSGLLWRDVSKVIAPILDDRVWAVSNNSNQIGVRP